MQSSYTVNDIRAKSVVIKTTGYKRINVTTMLAVFADGKQVANACDSKLQNNV
jgi:hypothetical protein